MGREGPKLTVKRESFIQGLIKGLSQRQAYIKAGYKTKNKTPEYIDTEACKLFKNPKVFQRYQELTGEIEKETKKTVVWGRERAYNELLELLADTKEAGQFPVRIGAIKELNALDDLYPKENKEDPKDKEDDTIKIKVIE